MQESNVKYFKNLNELLLYCDKLTDDKISRIYIDKQVLFKFPQLKKLSENYKEIEIIEEKKNLDTVSKIWEDMFENSIQRSSTVLCIGGGVLSDAVGFASSTYKRGTGFVIIPTTLLSMVDAAHGGKNGINTTHGKNQIGTFMMPDQVLICPEFLGELPDKQIKNGLIELIKAGFLKSPELVQQVYETDISKVNIELIKAAIWYSDLRDFTIHSETLPPDDLLRMLNQYFETVHQAVSENGGEVLRFIGDAMLIVFPIDDDMCRKTACNAAIDSAIDAQSTLASLNHQRRRHGQPEIKFGVGLNVGEVVYGNVGAPNRLDFTVMGPTVNRTARLEALTKTLGCNILFSKEFSELIDTPSSYLGLHEMKGIAEPQAVYAVCDS